MARIRSVEGTRVIPLREGWQVAATPTGSIRDPEHLATEKLDWCATTVPATAASALRAAGRWSFDDRVDFDAQDWWWRCRFPASKESPPGGRALRFGGIATLAEVWLNGRPILQSDNMFLEHEVDVGAHLGADNELVVCCRSLNAAMKARRPRPRWKTRLVAAQQLRWFRTSLLGRIPAWSPPAAPVGPWRPVVLEERSELTILRSDLRASMEGSDGVIDAQLVFASGPRTVESAVLHVGDSAHPLVCSPGAAGEVVARGETRVPHANRWWPHTHGAPARYPVSASIRMGGSPIEVDFGSTGFRSVELDQAGGAFALSINGTSLFCRGACWTSVDAAALTGAAHEYRRTLEAVRAAGMNIVRVCGPFFYEDERFYDLCDELGILVWQDFMFANMDYPAEDAPFAAGVEREARNFLDRTQLASCLTVLCGNSEVEQQSAMIGAPRELWRCALFARVLAAVSGEMRPDLPYWPSTPSGGALPFLNDVGTAHYFGVGAYMRPLDDARRAGVRFATECLAFANVPDERVVDELLSGGGTPPQDPRWKQRVPRDGAVGWDFEDVRDHYLRVLFGVDPTALRYADAPRYMALSRVVTGEVMAATFAEWRRTESQCAGALVWFLRDLWPGAGWGILDASGQPKPAYHYLRRALQPVGVFLVDEGLNGLDVHVVNESPKALECELHVALLRDGEAPVASARTPIVLPAGERTRRRLAEMLPYFLDSTHAYRFGPLAHDVTIATLTDRETGAVQGHAYAFPGGLPNRLEAELGLEALATAEAAGGWRLVLTTHRFAQSVALDIQGFSPSDNYFHVVPDRPYEVFLRPDGRVEEPRGTAWPLNSRLPTKLRTAR